LLNVKWPRHNVYPYIWGISMNWENTKDSNTVSLIAAQSIERSFDISTVSRSDAGDLPILSIIVYSLVVVHFRA
jgi:hypothetical protein